MKEQDIYNLIRENSILFDGRGQIVLQPFELTQAHYDAIRLLSVEEGQRMGVLCKKMLCDNSKMTRIIDHLVERGFAERRQDAMDRRAWQVFLLPAGAALREQAVEAHQTFLKHELSILSKDAQDELYGLLERLRNHLVIKEKTHD